MKRIFLPVLPLLAGLVTMMTLRAGAAPLIYEGTDGPAKGKQVVLIASDHEYKSEETLPELGRILARHYGAKCTVLFGVDPQTGFIRNGNSNIPGTEALKTADLLVIFTRFQNLPSEQMQPIVDYLDRGGPGGRPAYGDTWFQDPGGQPLREIRLSVQRR